MEGIGEENVGNDPAQPLDILALEETTSNPLTIAPIVNGLNTFYDAPGMYAMSPYQATESGDDAADGNGPNALVYNTTTVQLLASVPVDPPGGTSQLGSSSGEYREVMRYEFAPAGVTATANNEFYVYVSHYKSGTTAADATDRNGEAQIIRNDEANNLPATARVLYVGDYNAVSYTHLGDVRHAANHDGHQFAARHARHVWPDDQRGFGLPHEDVRGGGKCFAAARAQRLAHDPRDSMNDALQNSPVIKQRGKRRDQHDRARDENRKNHRVAGTKFFCEQVFVRQGAENEFTTLVGKLNKFLNGFSGQYKKISAPGCFQN